MDADAAEVEVGGIVGMAKIAAATEPALEPGGGGEARELCCADCGDPIAASGASRCARPSNSPIQSMSVAARYVENGAHSRPFAVSNDRPRRRAGNCCLCPVSSEKKVDLNGASAVCWNSRHAR